MDMPNFSLGDKVAIVTGSRRGIGRAVALTFARAGADLAICDNVIDTGELQAVAEDVKTAGRRVFASQVDISQKREVDYFISKVVDELGSIDILVNNAVFAGSYGPVIEQGEDEWNNVIDTDLKGYFLCSQVASKNMIARKKGSIINMTTIAAMRVGLGGAYDIAKAGVVMLTKALAKQLGSYNIRVNAIAPGTVRTELTRRFWSDPEFLTQHEASIPLGRIAETSDIIGPALFLASEASSYITGHTIVVDGGKIA